METISHPGSGSPLDRPPPVALRPGMRVGTWMVVADAPPLHHRGTSHTVISTVFGTTAVLDAYDVPRPSAACHAAARRVMQDLQRVEHRGALHVFDAGTLPDGRPFVVREHLEGIPLDQLVARGRPSRDLAISILLEICDVLSTAHAAGVTHGALGADTVLIDVRGHEPLHVKLIDWGLTHAIAEAAVSGAAGARGAPAWPDPAGDVRSVAVLAYELLEPVPDAVEPLLGAMLADDPRARATLRELRTALATNDLEETWFEEREPVAFHAVPMPDAGRYTRRWGWMTALAIAAAVLVVVFGVRQVRTPPPIVPAQVPVATRSLAPAVHEVAKPTPVRPAAATAPRPVAVTAPQPAPRPVTVTAPQPAPRPVRPTAATAPSTPAMPAIAASPPARVVVERTLPPRQPTASSRKATHRAPRVDADLLRRYQRVGRELIELQRRGEAVVELQSRFRSIRLDTVMATHHGRQQTASILRELESELAHRKAPPRLPDRPAAR